MRVLAYLLAAVVWGTAAADTTLVYDAERDPFTVHVRAKDIRIEGPGKRWHLYRRDEQTLYSVNPDEQNYVQLDPATASAIRAQMETLVERMQEQIAVLPEAQREAARAALAGRIPGFGGESKKAEVVASGDTDQVAGVECQIYDVRRGEATEQLCVTAPGALGMSDAEFANIGSMFGLMANMLAGTGLEYVGLPYLQVDGVPVRYANNVGSGTRTLSSVSDETLEDAMFEIPVDYNAQQPTLGP